NGEGGNHLGRYVRWIGHDHVEGPAQGGERIEEIAGEQSHARAEAEPAHVVRGHGQRAQRLVYREHLEVGPRGGEGAGNGSAARSDIGHEGAWAIGEKLERTLDETYGLRTRNEHVGRHGDPETAELLEAQDVLQGLVGGAPVDPRAEARGRLGVHGPPRIEVERETVRSQYRAKEAVGVLARAVEAGRGEAIGGLREELRHGDGHGASPSFRRCSSLLRASTSSSRSPSRMAGRRWRVRLIR